MLLPFKQTKNIYIYDMHINILKKTLNYPSQVGADMGQTNIPQARALAAQASQVASAGSHPCEEAPGATATPCTQ